jgi:hypothetical protein
MIPLRYVQRIPGLRPMPLLPDTWMADRPRGLGSYWITAHASGSAWKPAGLRLLRSFERSEGRNPRTTVGPSRTWHLHHIVELRHCADLDAEGWLARGRDSPFASLFAPCVLLSSEEHSHYTFWSLGARETPEIYSTGKPNARLMARSAEAGDRAASPAGRRELHRRLKDIRKLYSDAYEPEPILGAIASRVLDHLEEAILHPIP